MCKGLEEFWEMVRAEAEKQGLEEGRLAGLEKGREEGREEGILLTLLQLVRDGLLDLSVGIERSGISEAEFIEKLKQLA